MRRFFNKTWVQRILLGCATLALPLLFIHLGVSLWQWESWAFVATVLAIITLSGSLGKKEGWAEGYLEGARSSPPRYDDKKYGLEPGQTYETLSCYREKESSECYVLVKRTSGQAMERRCVKFGLTEPPRTFRYTSTGTATALPTM